MHAQLIVLVEEAFGQLRILGILPRAVLPSYLIAPRNSPHLTTSLPYFAIIPCIWPRRTDPSFEPTLAGARHAR